MPSSQELLESIDNRLKMLVRLRVQDKIENMDTNMEKIKLLHRAGFSDNEIAELIDSSPGSVRGLKSKLRNRGEIDD